MPNNQPEQDLEAEIDQERVKALTKRVADKLEENMLDRVNEEHDLSYRLGIGYYEVNGLLRLLNDTDLNFLADALAKNEVAVIDVLSSQLSLSSFISRIQQHIQNFITEALMEEVKERKRQAKADKRSHKAYQERQALIEMANLTEDQKLILSRLNVNLNNL